MFDKTSRWTYEDDRTYHGVNDDTSDDPDKCFHLVVELSEFGPTERETPYQLRRLRPEEGLGFGWGYNGGGTSQTSAAILRDALDLGPSESLSADLREDFCEDVVAHLPEEFYLRRGAVVRWARGWAAEHPEVELPAVVYDPPPVSRGAYQDRPQAVWDRRGQSRRRLGR